jgi:plasmid stability protein
MQKHKNINMRTTLDLPDELLTEIKILAAQERVTLKEVMQDILRAGLRARQIPAKAWAPPTAYRSTLRISRSQLSQMRKEIRL